MTLSEMAEMIGKRGLVPCGEGMTCAVVIADIKINYGRTRYLIRPVTGTGERWVDDSTLLF